MIRSATNVDGTEQPAYCTPVEFGDFTLSADDSNHYTEQYTQPERDYNEYRVFPASDTGDYAIPGVNTDVEVYTNADVTGMFHKSTTVLCDVAFLTSNTAVDHNLKESSI